MSSSSDRIARLIDGASLYATSKALGFDIDYKRLLKEFQNQGTLLRAFHYTAIIEDQDYASIRPLVDWLDYNGYTVITKAIKEFVDASGRRKIKGNMDIELAVDAMELAKYIDRMVCSQATTTFGPCRGNAPPRRAGDRGFDDFEPAADSRRRTTAQGRRFHGSQ
jgi:uncharacterized LabA/DUF88 family protein